MKERAHRAKMQMRDVIFISIASSDKFGQPFEYHSVYDLINKKQMMKHSITFISSIDLAKFFREKDISSIDLPSFSQENDQRMLAITTLKNQNLSIHECTDILQRHGIDVSNALCFYNEQHTKFKEKSIIYPLDNIYHHLKEFIKENNKKDIYMDELLVLLNTKSMFSTLDK